MPVFVMHDLQPKPVVFLLQGSGCLPAFTVDAAGRFDATSLFQDVLQPESSRVHFAMVENTLRRELHRAVQTREAADGKVASEW